MIDTYGASLYHNKSHMSQLLCNNMFLKLKASQGLEIQSGLLFFRVDLIPDILYCFYMVTKNCVGMIILKSNFNRMTDY